MSITTKVDEIKSLVEEMETDAEKFSEKGVKAAGKRVRKNAMLVKKLCHTLRQDVTAEM